MKTLLLPVLVAALLAGCAATPAPKPVLDALKQQVTGQWRIIFDKGAAPAATSSEPLTAPAGRPVR